MTSRDAGLAKNSAAIAMSSGSPILPSGMRPGPMIGPFSSMLAPAAFAPGVSTPPGSTALTRMPSAANSSAVVFVRLLTPAFEAL